MTAEAQEPDSQTAVRDFVLRTLPELVDLPDAGRADLAEGTPLASLGVDSLARAELAVVVEQELGIVVPDDQWATLTSVGEVISYLVDERGRTDDGGAGN